MGASPHLQNAGKVVFREANVIEDLRLTQHEGNTVKGKMEFAKMAALVIILYSGLALLLACLTDRLTCLPG